MEDQDGQTNSGSLEESDLTAAAQNLAQYFSSLEGQEQVESTTEAPTISDTHHHSGNDDEEEIHYADIAQMLEAAAAAVEEGEKKEKEEQPDQLKIACDDNLKKDSSSYDEGQTVKEDDNGDPSLENLQASLNDLVRLHGLDANVDYEKNHSTSEHPISGSNEESQSLVTLAPDDVDQSIASTHSREATPDDLSNILLNALELALEGDQTEPGTKEVASTQNFSGTSEKPSDSGPQEAGEEPGFDLEMLQELLMSADHVKSKDDLEKDQNEVPEVHDAEDPAMEEPQESRQDGHQEILAQLSSLLHPDDMEETLPSTGSSAQIIESLSGALDEQSQKTQENKEDEDPSAIDFSLVVSAIQSALQEAATENDDLDKGVDPQEFVEDQRGAFSKTEIQDALKSLTDSDGSILLDLSSKNLGQRINPPSQGQDDAETVEEQNDEDDEETMRSTANLVEVLLKSGLLNAENLTDRSLVKAKSKSIQRQLPSAAARAKNLRQPKTPTSQYNSTMSIAETLAYTRSHMNQRPTEAKIDPMVTRRELNRAALLKARQLGQARGSSKTAPTYYIPPSSPSQSSTADKDLSYRLYPSSSTTPSKSADASKSQRGQFRLSSTSEDSSSQNVSASAKKRPARARFYYYTPPSSSFKSGQNSQDKSGPSFAPHAPKHSATNALSESSIEVNHVATDDSHEEGDHNLLAALLLAKRAFGSQMEGSHEALTEPETGEKGQSEIVDAETMKAIQAALEAVGTSLGDENKQIPSEDTRSSLPPLPLPIYPEYASSRTSSPTPSDATVNQTPRGSFSSMSSPLRRPRRKLTVGGVMTTDERERVRHENRERKKRWRGQNMDRNRDNDLRGRVTRRANQIYGAANTPQKMKWIEAEFQNRRMKRMERGIGFDSFSFSKGPKATNPVQSVMPEGSQQRFGSTEAELEDSKMEDDEENSEYGFQTDHSNSLKNNWSSKLDHETRISQSPQSQTSSRRNSGSYPRPKPLSSGGTNPSFFASRGAKAPTPLPMGGIVTSFKVKTNRTTTPKSKAHLLTPSRQSIDSSSLPPTLTPEIAASLKRKRSISGNVSTTSPALSSQTMYSAGIIPSHLIPADISPVPLPKPLPFNGTATAKKPSYRISTPGSSGDGEVSGSASPTRQSISSTVSAVAERIQEQAKSSDDNSADKTVAPSPGRSSLAASPAPASSPRVAPNTEDKRVRAMGFPPIFTGMTLRR